ncbi:MAG TPA: sulfatase-like hydrolase/transferase [Chthoniobacterales bacterium]|jgi:arylsulfatase A-like enzyme
MAEIVSRRDFLRTAALGSTGLALTRGLKAQPARLARKPNLLVFLPDQQRPDTIGCYGGGTTIAPNLSKLATQSFVFENAYVTHPLCAPSRSSLLTGTWPHANGCTHNGLALPHRFRCLPELIGDSDYRFAYMGKWHLGDELSAQRGFSDWISILDGHDSRLGEHHTIAACDYDRFLVSKGLQPDLNAHGIFSRGFGARLPLELSKPKFLEINACNFLEQHRHDPFVLFVAFYEPHPPYNGPLNDEHSLDEMSLDPTSNHVFADDMPLRYRLRQEWDLERYGSDPIRHRKIKQRYLGLVSEIDQSIGTILTKLEELGLADDTVVVHTSDHGDMMSAHRMFGKEVVFQEAVRVPYLVRLPEQRKMVQVRKQISHIDFAPTVLDLLGRPPAEQCAGTSRAGLLRGEDVAADTVFIERSPVRRAKFKKHTRLASAAEVKRATNESTRVAISPDGWKLCLRDADKNELYNLRSDSFERQNLYARSDMREVISRLAGEIHAWQEKNADSVKLSLAV